VARSLCRRYRRERPGELAHVDVKKLAGIPDGGGWRVHGRLHGPDHTNVGYRYIHTAIDDRTRLAYSEIHRDEQGVTAAGFWHRALTDNGPCYRSRRWLAALADTGVAAKRTRPYRPQTNGKVERFHRILLEEWAYIRDWHNDHDRTARLRRVHALLQSAPFPRRTRLGHTHRHSQPPTWGQPPRHAQLATSLAA